MLSIHLYYKLGRKEEGGAEGFSNTGYLHIVFSDTAVSFWALLLNCFPVKKGEWLTGRERCEETKTNDHSYIKVHP